MSSTGIKEDFFEYALIYKIFLNMPCSIIMIYFRHYSIIKSPRGSKALKSPRGSKALELSIL